jgi:hypothetical protein
MKPILTIAVLAAFLSAACGQSVSYFNQGFLRQPSAAADIAYLGITSSGLPAYVVTNTGTGYTLGGTFTGTFNGTYNTSLNGILQGNGVTMGTVTIGAGLNYVGTTLSAVGGSGTVTTFSAGNLSPLFTTSVANPGTTPALSFAQVSQNQNLVFASPDAVPGNPTFRALVSGDIPSLAYVTSVGLALPVSVFAISGSPVTTSGTLTGTFQNQNANTVFAGPTSGGATTPAFRALVAADLPAGTTPSLPGLLVRPVSALVSGTLQAPTWPDDDTYYFDEEFDSMLGTTAGQFGKYLWSTTAAGGGGGITSSVTNTYPHLGILGLQSPSAATASFSVEQNASSVTKPYGSLGVNSNWLFHAVFRFATSNQGSIYRLGLEDSSFAVFGSSLTPSNCIAVRWDKNKNDPENFVFEGCSNSVRNIANSTIRPDTNLWFKLTIMCTNAGVALCAINGENWVTISNIPTESVGIAATVATTNANVHFFYLDRVSFMASSVGR